MPLRQFMSESALGSFGGGKMEGEDTGQFLPVLKFGGEDFLVDIPARKFLHAGEPASGVSFYSEMGRRMVVACTDYDFRAYRVFGEV